MSAIDFLYICFLLITVVLGTFDPSIHDIHNAVDLYEMNKTQAFQQYGNISHWNTAGITEFNSLFQGLQTFNEPLFWDTSELNLLIARSS